MITDTGTRTEFDTGAVRDIKQGKGRCDLMPIDVISNVLSERYPAASSVLSMLGEFVDTGDISKLYGCIDTFISDVQGVDVVDSLLDLSHHFEEGAIKYGEHNWEKGIPAHSYVDSAIRHLLKVCRGDTDESHERAFIWNISCLIWTVTHKPELVDLAYIEEAADVSEPPTLAPLFESVGSDQTCVDTSSTTTA